MTTESKELVQFLRDLADEVSKKSLTPKTIDMDKFEFPVYTHLSKKKEKTEEEVKKPLKKVKRDVLTENGAKAFSTTNSDLLDLFMDSIRDFDKERIFDLMDKCWKISPVKTFQLVLYVRDVREGKGEIKLGRFMLLWIRIYHPATYVNNLHLFSRVGYPKDWWRLLDLIHLTQQPNLGQNTFVEIEFFLQVLLEDEKNFKDKKSISLYPKWTPKEKSHYHKYLDILAKLKFPNDKKSLEHFRKWLKPMRESNNILETKMCEKKWQEIKYEQVPSYAMKLNSKVLERHDQEGFKSYIEKLKAGKTKINVTGIQPHELVRNFLSHSSQDNLDVAEGQWNELIKRSKKNTKLGRCLAVSDVSGSMSGVPMEVSISLGLLLSLVQPDKFTNKDGKDIDNPYYRKLITFSENPTLHQVEGKTLSEQVQSVANMSWGMNTNFIAVFKLLLNTALMYSVPQENMVETIFVFTDMQFDQAGKSTPFDEVEKMYKDAGYTLPKIVFWNLRCSSGGFPIQCDKKGVALVSGFSAELLRLFVEGKDFDPITILESALEKYKDVEIHKSDLQ